MSEAEREARTRADNAELRKTLRDPAANEAPTAVNDLRDAARKQLPQIPLAYTPEAFVESVGKRKAAAALLFLKAGIGPDSAGPEGQPALMAAADSAWCSFSSSQAPMSTNAARAAATWNAVTRRWQWTLSTTAQRSPPCC